MTQYDAPINANDASFERAVLQSPLPVMAVFWSPKVVPRQQLSDVLEQVAVEYAGEALVVKLDVADAPQAREQYDAGELPHFLFFRRRCDSFVTRYCGSVPGIVSGMSCLGHPTVLNPSGMPGRFIYPMTQSAGTSPASSGVTLHTPAPKAWAASL